MTEDQARAWVAERYPDHMETIAAFLAMVVAENDRQNLIAPSTVDRIWSRHAVDSLQLVAHAGTEGRWIDVGTGGGFPGVIVAIVRAGDITLIEPRRKRADFLRSAIAALNLAGSEVAQQRAETVERQAAVISARAVASIERLLDIGSRWSTATTQWILPRGAVSEEEMALLRLRFGMLFHVEHSITSDASMIVVAQGRPA